MCPGTDRVTQEERPMLASRSRVHSLPSHRWWLREQETAEQLVHILAGPTFGAYPPATNPG